MPSKNLFVLQGNTFPLPRSTYDGRLCDSIGILEALLGLGQLVENRAQVKGPTRGCLHFALWPKRMEPSQINASLIKRMMNITVPRDHLTTVHCQVTSASRLMSVGTQSKCRVPDVDVLEYQLIKRDKHQF